MKSFKKILIVISILSLFSQSCRKGSMWGIKGEGPTVTEQRTLSGFTAIDLSIDADVTFVQDSVYLVEVSAQKNILTILETTVEGGTLTMDYKRNLWQHNKVRFTIHAPTISKLNLGGSGNIEVSNKISAESLDLIVSGSGNITVGTVTLQNLSAKISGSGNIQIREGKCKNETLTITGSGNINTEFMPCENADVNINGSGDVTVNCSETLKVKISGDGNVFYRGKASVNSNISGSGKVVHLD